MNERTGKFILNNRAKLILFFLMLSILGAWLNAQGGWVKDFAYNKSVTLPFLFSNYYTTGFMWYLAGMFDDLLGLASNLVGIYGFKKLVSPPEINIYRRKYFIIPLIVYFAGDIAAFLNYNSYYNGFTSVSLYGELWNIYQYFVLIPALILADLFLLTYRTERYNG